MTELEYNQATLDDLEKELKKYDTFKRSSQRMDVREKYCLLKGEIYYSCNMIGLYCENKFELMEGFKTYKMR